MSKKKSKKEQAAKPEVKPKGRTESTKEKSPATKEPVVRKEPSISKNSRDWKAWVKTHKLPLGIAGGVLLLIISALVVGLVWRQAANQNSDNGVGSNQKSKKKLQQVEGESVSITNARQIDGILVATAESNRVPACVMIENAAFSGVRPQSGLSAASVVYEVIVEGGITRLMAVFAGEQTDPVGPVRSARDTYLEFASEYNCGYVHAGGSYTAINAIPRFGLRDLDALRESRWFWRDAHKYSPHDLFTNTSNLYEAITTGHSWTDSPTYESWKFVDDVDLPNDDSATEINLGFGGSYDVTYTFNSEDGYYERINGGQNHTDSNTGKILTARNIIVQHVPEGDFIEGKGRVNFSVTGEGEVNIFRNGMLTTGIWKKADRLARTKFYTSDGQEIPLVRGNTWVEIVPDGYSVDWK